MSERIMRVQVPPLAPLYNIIMKYSYLPHADYLSDCFDIKKRVRTVNRLWEFVIKEKIEFDSIAVMGISGLVIGSILSYRLGSNLCVVRKTKRTHSENKVESGFNNIESYLIIDDLMDSGKTVRSIIKEIRNADNINGSKRCVGGIFYNSVELDLKQLE